MVFLAGMVDGRDDLALLSGTMPKLLEMAQMSGRVLVGRHESPD
jgi:hypothetical protein